MIHVCKNPEMGGGFHFLAHGLLAAIISYVQRRFAHVPPSDLNCTMDYSRHFSSTDVVSWLGTHRFSSETSERIGKQANYMSQHIFSSVSARKFCSIRNVRIIIVCSFFFKKRTQSTGKIY